MIDLFRGICTLFLLLWAGSIFSQEKNAITGIVKTKENEPIPFSTISIKPIENKRIISFTSTDSHGKFKLSIPQNISFDGLEILVSHINYGKKQIALDKTQFVYEIILQKDNNLIDSVHIKRYAKISQRGDTLNYSVEGFSKNEDRSIGDVLKRMPGFDVADNGEIRFNNRPISNFYIDGDDLLGGKYGIGSKTIPYDMVKNINVYTNHEHIKVNKDKYKSNDVAINLEIKEDAKIKLKGMANVGIGTPTKYNSEINTILINKKFKMLNSLKGNNVGEDLSVDLLDLLLGTSNQAKLVGSSTISSPPIQRKRHFINNSGMFTANNSHRFKNDLFVRSNINAHIQKRKIEFEGINNIFIVNDTISFKEYQKGNSLSKILGADIYAEINQSSFYLKNDFKFNTERDNILSDLNNSVRAFEQGLQSKTHLFTNNLHYIPTLKNQNILSVDWLLTKNRIPQYLTFEPGILESVFNNNQLYKTLNQKSEIDQFSNFVTANYRVRNKKIQQNYGVEMGHTSQVLSSRINVVDSTGINLNYQGGLEDNNLKLGESNISIYSRLKYKYKNAQLSLTLPVRYAYVKYNEENFHKQGQKSFLLIEPSFILDQQVNLQDKVSISYSLKNSINDIRALYQGAIIVNHRTIQQNRDFRLWSRKTQSFLFDYSIKRPLKMVFANITGSYSVVNSDILNTVVLESNVQKQLQIDYANQVKTTSLHANLSKYLFFLATTITFKTGWNSVKMNNFYNNDLYDFSNNNYTLSTSLDFQLFKFINVSQKFDINHFSSESRPQSVKNEISKFNVNQLKSSTSLTYSTSKNFHLRTLIESIHMTQKSMSDFNYYFVDFNANWKIPKLRSELEFNVSNIFNREYFHTFSIHNNGFIQNSFRINPRIGMIKYIFNF